MRRASVVVPASVLCLAAVFAPYSPPAGAVETLASADFEADSAGDFAKPGTPSVSEDLWDCSSGSGGGSLVTTWAGGKRYQISDIGASGLSKGIRAPFSSAVSSGTLVAEAVLVAEQTGGEATFYIDDPWDEKWLGCAGFRSDGKFCIHGNATQVSYASGRRYRTTVTVHFGSSPTVDYLVVDLTDSSTVIDSMGHPIQSGLTAGDARFVTGATPEGTFDFDDLLVTH